MEEQTIMEQPAETSGNVENAQEQIDNTEFQSNQPQQSEGSIYGKFKDATSLLNAYNNLEKEFTRKSQKLSQLLKNTEGNTNQNDTSQHTKQPIEEISQTTNKPAYLQSDWRVKVSQFFNQNPEAKNYSKQIANELISDKHLSSNQNCLEYAYSKILKQNRVEPASLVDDQQFLDNYVYSNDKIKQRIIEDYILSLNNSPKQPRFISGEPSTISVSKPSNKPQTLKEASNILKKLLQS